ncbi:MAG: penicillin-binding Tp47 domain C-containing protein [Blautia faecicola]
MNNKRVKTKAMAMAVAAAMAVDLCPVTAFAVTGSKVAEDGTYTATGHVTQTEEDDPEDWGEYDVTVSLTVKDGKFEDIQVTPGGTYDSSVNKTYLSKAYDKSKGIKVKLAGQDATEDTISGWDTKTGATRTSAAIKQAALEAIQSAPEKTAAVEIDTTALETAIAAAEGKNEADYTADSWSAVQEKLAAARAALEAKTSQEEVTKAATELDAAVEALVKAQKETYVLMNIPYDQFYKADVNNNVKVDAFTSATKNKVRTGSLAGGSYHVDASGDEITGVTFPVKVPAGIDLSKYTQITDDSKVSITVTNKGQESTTDYTGKDALFESASYSYYTLSEKPSYYKELTVNEDGSFSFGATQGTAATITEGVTAELKTDSKYGDYQLKLEGLDNTIPPKTTAIYGVIVSTKEGSDYGMRHLENIYKVSKLAWATGFTSVVHGCPTSSEHYKAMMGQHINKVTYYTAKGIYEIPVGGEEGLYVPVKFDTSAVTVADAELKDGGTSVATTISGLTLPESFDAEYTVDGATAIVEGEKLILKDVKKGAYTLTITDKSGKYAPISVGFEVKGDSVQEINTASLEKAIQSAEALKEADYTADSWKALQVALKNAKSALEAKKDQTSVDESTEHLNAAIAALVKAETKEEYKYVYAALSYQEYWGAEGVQAAGSSVSSDTKDTHGEYDKGAFDAVTRATTNHGLHRGNFQQDVTIYDTEGNAYDMAYWDGKTKIVLTDGTSIGFSRGTITLPSGETKTMATYKIKGIKYVPVQVAAEDYDDFKAKYTVVENGDTLAGGYGEGKLSSYSGLVAEVDANTNGLKKATKNADGTYSFGKRQTGTGSGIKDVKLQSTELTPVVQDTSSYGDFIRMDVKENYGEVGAKMQTVVWTYYGDGDTPLAAYGTKFAADNWMHKSNGIQLGLTDSLRCNLPEGKDGTGKWTVTIYALGYADTTMTINVTADDIHAATPVSDTSKLEAAVAKADALNKDDYTEESWSALETELKEAKADLAAAVKGTTSQESVDESTEHLNAAIAALVKAQKETYVLMNIPYDQFYKADVNNDVKVDAFTSATKNKVRTGSLAGGSYHVDASGDEITGVTFPVKVPAGTDLSKYTQITDDSKVSITVTNRGQESTTDYTGKDALFESASYSYYTLSEKPSYYKELTVNEDGTFSFGATQGTATTITEGVTAELMTESKYGDYQLDLDGLTDTIPSGTAIYGVIVSTKEGSDYGMRHLENIWRVSELAWATGFTTAVHNCPTSSEHYKAMMGQHIDKVTYYTANGIYEIPVGGEKGLYVPVKFDTSAVAVADAELKDGETSVATTISGLTLPEGFDAEYTVDGATAIVKGEKLILKDVKKGAYTLTITDKSGKYAPISVGFEVYAETIPASYNENAEKPGLTKAAGSTDAEFADYIKNITSVSVNGKSYAASGRGAVKLFNDDGTLITDAAPFAEGDSFEIVVSATGYKDLSFTYKKASSDDPTQEVNTASLEKAIQTAEALKEADYTADSWKVLQTALKNAKSALEAKKDQTSVDNAAASLNKAIEALVKADGTTPTPTPTTTPASSKNNTTTSGTGNKTTSSGSTSTSKTAKTGDPTNIFEMLGLAVASLGTGGFALKRRKRNKK